MEKQRWEESEKRRAEERRSEKRKSQKKENTGARKGRKVAKHFVFPMICGSGGSKSRLAKAAGVEPSGQMRDEKLHAVVARSTIRSQNVQNTPRSDHIGSWDVEKGYTVAAQSTRPSQNVEGRFAEDLQRCMSRGRRSTRDMFIRDVRRSGRWFPERGCILEHEIFKFAEMILRDRRSTSYDLASLFRGRRNTLDRWSGTIAIRIGTRPSSALHSTFYFWRKSRRQIERVSLNCFGFDIIKFKSWGRLAELLRFWCCQVQELRKTRRIASFSSLQIDR